jgi:hypothetical protein
MTNSAFFDNYIDFFATTKSKLILALFANFKAKTARNDFKQRKTSVMNVSWNSAFHPSVHAG